MATDESPRVALSINSAESLERVVQRSIQGMTWLSASDEAAAVLACKYARAIDAAVEGLAEDARGDSAGAEAMTKALYLGPHLLKALAALGGTPAERKALAEGGKVGSKLESFRAKREGRGLRSVS